MLNGIYRNPTTIHFGKGTELRIGEEVAKYSKRVLLHFGGVSFRKYGLYEIVRNSLTSSGIKFVELGGVVPNPRASLVYEGIEICRREKLDFILAVGGGSVIDSAKAIGIGVPYDGDFSDFFEKKRVPQMSINIGVILTIPGSGSESSDTAVITHEQKAKKSDCSSPLMYPAFAILNPEYTLTVPHNYICRGIADAVSHVLERFFSKTDYVDCTDRICEGLIKTLMKYGVLVGGELDNYDVRAEIMWACKMAHDNTAGFGRKQDWSCHKISHEIGICSSAAHGSIISVIFPSWMEHVYRLEKGRFLQLAERVFDIELDSLDENAAILQAIGRFRQFLRAMGMPSTLRELGFADKSQFRDIAERCVSSMPSRTIGNYVRLTVHDIEAILDSCF